MLKGTTPKQTIPVLVLRPTKAEHSDDTIVYEDQDTVQPTPGEPDDPKDGNKEGNTGTQEPDSTDSGNPKTGNKKRTLRLIRYVIHRPKKQKPKRFKCTKCSRRYETLRKLNRHFRKNHHKV